jgi:ABC-2 type transport system permease protein
MNIVFGAPYWEYRIREGDLNRDLLRPVLPLHYDIAWFAGWKVVMIVLWLPIAFGLSLVFDPTLDPRPAEIATFAIAIWGAYPSARCSRSRSGCSASGRRGARRSSTCT